MENTRYHIVDEIIDGLHEFYFQHHFASIPNRRVLEESGKLVVRESMLTGLDNLEMEVEEEVEVAQKMMNVWIGIVNAIVNTIVDSWSSHWT